MVYLLEKGRYDVIFNRQISQFASLEEATTGVHAGNIVRILTRIRKQMIFHGVG
jgi:hypothetical protein